MPFEPPALDKALQLAVALAIGLLVGTERGWKSRALGEGHRALRSHQHEVRVVVAADCFGIAFVPDFRVVIQGR